LFSYIKGSDRVREKRRCEAACRRFSETRRNFESKDQRVSPNGTGYRRDRFGHFSRRAGRGQGQYLHRGAGSHLRIEDPYQACPALQRDGN